MRIVKVVICMLLFIGTAFTAGCVESQRTDLSKEGVVTVDTKPSRKVKILWYDVYIEGQEFVVSGAIQQIGLSNYGIKANLNITVYSPGGNVLHEKDITGISVPRKVPGDGIKWRKFRARFPGKPEQGSTVTITVI